MKKGDQVRQVSAKKCPSTQVQTLAPKSIPKINSELFYILIDLSPEDRKKQINLARSTFEAAESFVKSTIYIDSLTAPKIPKGFVMVNLATWQQKELRNLANECGVDLRYVLRWALTEVRSKLKEKAELKRKTGLNFSRVVRLLCLNSKGN